MTDQTWEDDEGAALSDGGLKRVRENVVETQFAAGVVARIGELDGHAELALRECAGDERRVRVWLVVVRLAVLYPT